MFSSREIMDLSIALPHLQQRLLHRNERHEMEQNLSKPRAQSSRARSGPILLFYPPRRTNRLCGPNALFLKRPEAHLDRPNCHRPRFYIRSWTVASVYPFRGHNFLQNPQHPYNIGDATVTKPG